MLIETKNMKITNIVLKDEMKWSKRPNKTPTILEVLLEFKADLIEDLRWCTYRGNTQGHTLLIEAEEELSGTGQRIRSWTSSEDQGPKKTNAPRGH